MTKKEAVKQIREEAERIVRLTNDPEFGLVTWRRMLDESVRKIATLGGYVRGQ